MIPAHPLRQIAPGTSPGIGRGPIHTQTTRLPSDTKDPNQGLTRRAATIGAARQTARSSKASRKLTSASNVSRSSDNRFSLTPSDIRSSPEHTPIRRTNDYIAYTFDILGNRLSQINTQVDVRSGVRTREPSRGSPQIGRAKQNWLAAAIDPLIGELLPVVGGQAGDHNLLWSC